MVPERCSSSRNKNDGSERGEHLGGANSPRLLHGGIDEDRAGVKATHFRGRLHAAIQKVVYRP